jgi:hypothetical protein
MIAYEARDPDDPEDVAHQVAVFLVPRCPDEKKICFQATHGLCQRYRDNFRTHWVKEGHEGPVGDVPVEVRVYLPSGTEFAEKGSMDEYPANFEKGTISVLTSVITGTDPQALGDELHKASRPLFTKALNARDSWPCVVCGALTKTYNSASELRTTSEGETDVYLIQILYTCPERAKGCLLAATKRMDGFIPREVPNGKICSGCGMVSHDPKLDFKRCQQCRINYYCGKLCQRIHWPTHKDTCSRLAGKADEAS